MLEECVVPYRVAVGGAATIAGEDEAVGAGVRVKGTCAEDLFFCRCPCEPWQLRSPRCPHPREWRSWSCKRVAMNYSHGGTTAYGATMGGRFPLLIVPDQARG